MKIICSLFILLMISHPAKASIAVGAGLSSGMSGRYIPGLNAAYISSDWALSATTIGAQTPVYYINDYTLCYNRVWKPGKFLWGDLKAGFGGGVGYSQRGLRTSTATSTYDTRSEILVGPSIRVTWDIMGPVQLTFDSLFGFGLATINLPPLMHDLAMFSLGFEL